MGVRCTFELWKFHPICCVQNVTLIRFLSAMLSFLKLNHFNLNLTTYRIKLVVKLMATRNSVYFPFASGFYNVIDCDLSLFGRARLKIDFMIIQNRILTVCRTICTQYPFYLALFYLSKPISNKYYSRIIHSKWLSIFTLMLRWNFICRLIAHGFCFFSAYIIQFAVCAIAYDCLVVGTFHIAYTYAICSTNVQKLSVAKARRHAWLAKARTLCFYIYSHFLLLNYSRLFTLLKQ